jgi:outer membrane receptor for ferrienterochelin and colicin
MLTWQNVDKSYVEGIELDGKKALVKGLDLMANVTFVKSNTTFTRTRLEFPNGVRSYVPLDQVSRPMFGQAPYIVNVILSYSAPEKTGLTATLSYNVQGRRLAISSGIKEIPDVYEMPRNMFDFKITKTLGKYFSVSLTARDILNTAIRRAYIYSDGTKIDYDKYRYGTNYVLTVSYKL